jgi:hypothetical protein
MEKASKVCLVVLLMGTAGLAFADRTYDPIGENNRAM